MLLLIDVGNTETVMGLAQEDTIVSRWRISTQPTNTGDMIAADLLTFFTMRGYECAHISGAVLASVVPKLELSWKLALKSLDIPVTCVGSDEDGGLAYGYEDPSEIGPDRIANAVGAIERYGAPVIVVDFGTATNIDVIDAQGRYLGGTISPGMNSSAEALFSRAARLASIPIVVPDKIIGSTTTGALQAGIVYGTASQVEGLVHRIKGEMNEPDAPVIATGGLSHLIASCATCFNHVDPDLTLRGLYLIGKRQK